MELVLAGDIGSWNMPFQVLLVVDDLCLLEYARRFSCLKDYLLFQKKHEWTRSIAFPFKERICDPDVGFLRRERTKGSGKKQ